MDQNLQNVILGVVANALTSVLAQAGRGLLRSTANDTLVEQLVAEKNSLSSIQEKAARALSEVLDWPGPPSLEETCLFLSSPEAEGVVRQLVSTQLSALDVRSKHLDLIQREFTVSFSLFVGAPEDSLRAQGRALLEQLVRACEAAVNEAIDLGVLSAHEAKSAFRHHVLLDELSGIRRTLGFLTAPARPDVKEILRFEAQYRAQVGTRHSHIVPPNFDGVRRVPIDALYEPSDFLMLGRTKGDQPYPSSLPTVLQSLRRAVILGNPGGGKSTLMSKLCHDLSTSYAERHVAGRELTPVLVILRDYGADKKAHGRSIVQFIEGVAASKYQVSPPPGAFEYLLLNGRVAVFFDGLDELLDTSYRQEVSADVESFGTLYPAVPIVVTSREVGYEQAPLDERRYQAFRLAPFNERQVSGYAAKWFACDADLTTEQQGKRARAFIEESRIVSDLRSNPLMLALMCNIYRGENYIPRNRPDVYEKCALMLFERWDKSRGIEVHLPFEAHVSSAMKFLAHWIYSDEALQSGVTEKQLVDKAGEYLCSWRYEDSEEGKQAARNFIDFCRGRAWVFTDTGTRKEGERLYQFTHRTFLEYFTAGHLVRTQSTTEALLGVLRPRIERREWDVVAQLAFQLLNKNVEGAGDRLVAGLLEGAERARGWKALNRLSFAARCLEFMVPRPALTREIVGAVVKRCVARKSRARHLKMRPAPKAIHEESAAEELLGELLYAAAENRPVIAGMLEKLLVDRANSKEEGTALGALEVGLYLSSSLYRRQGPPATELSASWLAVSQRIFERAAPRVQALAQRHFESAYDAVHFGSMGLTELARLHGIRSLFRVRRAPLLNSMVLSIADNVFESALKGPAETGPWGLGWQQRADAVLPEIGDLLIGAPVPWMAASGRDYFPWVPYTLRRLPRMMAHPEGLLGRVLDGDALFGAFAVFAPAFESCELHGELAREGGKVLLQSLQQQPSSSLGPIGVFCLARLGRATKAAVEAQLETVGLPAEKRRFVERWTERGLDLVGVARGRGRAASRPSRPAG